MLESLNRPTHSLETIHHWVGNGAEILVKRALSESSEIDPTLDESFCQDALKTFLNFYANNLTVKTVTYPHVHTTLTQLKEHGYRLAIVTNKPFKFVAPILKALELEEFFELILGGDSLAKRKPDPMPLLHVCEKLNVAPHESLMVGDSKNDIVAANSAKMESIGLTYGYNYGESINIYNPTAVFDDFSSLITALINGE